MGVTGAGKSYFIKEVSGSSEVEVSDDLYSCTTKVQAHSFGYAGAKITLVDTPGFNDTNRADTDVLKDICDWTSETYKKKRLISGIIYLHRISDVRMEGSALKNLRMFQKLCGPGALQNVLLTTTQWANVNPADGEFRENRLRNEDFWGGLIGKGATLQRFDGTRESGLELIHKLMSNTPKALDIQGQIVDQHMSILETDAGKTINEELIAREKKYKEELESLERERQEAIRAKDDEMKEILAQEQAKAQKNLEKAAAEKKMLAELHAAEIEKRERREKAVIAVATKDIGIDAHIENLVGTSDAFGYFVLDINDDEEFKSERFKFRIDCDSGVVVSLFTAAFKTVKEVIGDTGMNPSNFIEYNGVRYWYKADSVVKRDTRKFVIFSRRS
ncbi:hypothetical protein L873DRAFT_1737537 [Choiromyces venosus 120613-1]|uniref:G domain-containing protein n=1 Tax=Choiromyces venosus 120613-1 TaxID=1336337 RepID=A0A3N4JNJ8_9PEZI|nr:hypothetical protein L873DRAFT_1737537 [Choiromyces venosus 120613-1]